MSPRPPRYNGILVFRTGPYISTKERYISAKEPSIHTQEAYTPHMTCTQPQTFEFKISNIQRYLHNAILFFLTEPCMSAKEPSISAQGHCMSVKEPCISAKEPCSPQKNPLSPQKRPVSPQNSPVSPQKSPVCQEAYKPDRTSPNHRHSSPRPPRYNAILNFFTEPYIPAKEPRTCKRQRSPIHLPKSPVLHKRASYLHKRAL